MTKKVLVFPAGTAIGTEIYASLHNSKHFNLFGASSCVDNGTLYPEFKVISSYATSPTLPKEIGNLLLEHNIDIILPAHDDALVALKRAFGPLVAGSPQETVEICRSKSNTYQVLQEHMPTPTLLSNPTQFPVFIKPDQGQGSRGARLIKNRGEFDSCIDPHLITLEYLPGQEYTVDCFTDRHRTLRYVNPRQRVVVANGISTTSRLTSGQVFDRLAEVINSVLQLRGAWFFQLKENKDGKLTLLEVAPRIAGSSGINRVNGINLTELTLWDYLDEDVTIPHQALVGETIRILTTVFSLPDYNELYVDLDDCLVINGKVNSEVITFILQEKNKDKNVTVLTRSANPYFTQCDLGGLFSQTIQVSKEEPKSKYMKPGSLLIDDSFKERNEVQQQGHIALSPQALNMRTT